MLHMYVSRTRLVVSSITALEIHQVYELNLPLSPSPDSDNFSFNFCHINWHAVELLITMLKSDNARDGTSTVSRNRPMKLLVFGLGRTGTTCMRLPLVFEHIMTN